MISNLKIKNKTALVRNTLSNYMFVMLMGIISFFATPFYIKNLGGKEWGLVAICMTIQGVLLLFDIGLSQILPSQVAKFKHLKKEISVYKAAHKFYFFLALIIFIIGQILAPYLCRGLTYNDVGLSIELEPLIRLLLLQFLFQFPNNAAVGFWNGMEMQHEANVRQFTFMLLKHLFALIATICFQRAYFYMLPFVLFAFLEYVLNRKKVVLTAKSHAVVQNGNDYSITKLLPQIWWFSLAVFFGMLLFQIDRLYLLRHLKIELYGYYVAISNFSLLFMHLYAPIYRVFLPKISVTTGVSNQHWKVLLILVVTCFIPCCIVAIFSENFLYLWLGDRNISHLTAPTFSLLVLAVGFNGLNSLAYMIYIRDGLYRNLLFLNIFILIVEYLVLCTYTSELSILSGGIALFLALTIQFLYGCFYLYKSQKTNSANPA